MLDNGTKLNDAEISRTLEPLQKRWKHYRFLNQITNILLCFGPMAFIFGGMLFYNHMWEIYRFFPLALLAVILLVGLTREWNRRCSKARKEYTTTYKRLVSRPVLASCFDNARFDPDAGYTREEFQASGLMHITYNNTYASEDLITGSYQGCNFRRADIQITHMSGGKHPHMVVDADGRLLEIELKREIDGVVKIVKESQTMALFDKSLADSMVETEDMEFNQKFNVYARDRHSAFYLLTPQFMEYIKQLYDRDDKIYITFDGEKLYFLQSRHGGIFEPPDGKLDIQKEVRKSRAELAEIGRIIDLLGGGLSERAGRTQSDEQKLNHSEWMKEADDIEREMKKASGGGSVAGEKLKMVILVVFVIGFVPFVMFLLSLLGKK